MGREEQRRWRSKGGRPEVNVVSAGQTGRTGARRLVIGPLSWAELRGRRSSSRTAGAERTL